jgi:hypothetical protein
MTPLRAAAFEFAVAAGYQTHDVKVRPNRNCAYDVLVRAPGGARGRCIGAILLRAVYPVWPWPIAVAVE